MTLDFYDSDPEGYSEKTFGADMSHIRDRFTKHLPPGASILDLGCGSGRDSLAFSEEGFDVTPVDGSERMCRIAESNTGMKVRRLLFSELDYEDSFDGVWACASLLHVCSRDLPDVTGGVRRSLKADGIFFCCFKHGDFEGIRDGRHYTDMTSDSLRTLLMSSGFEPIDMWMSESGGITWVNCVSRKVRCDAQCAHQVNY